LALQPSPPTLKLYGALLRGNWRRRARRKNATCELHLTAIDREDGLSETDAKRCADILAFTINLEHIGDILDKSLRELAAKKIKQRLTFSEEGLREIAVMHQRLLDNLHLATSVFMMGDIRAARSLLAEKDRMRDQEQAAFERGRVLHERRLPASETGSSGETRDNEVV
jgi:phosphate:Na+ symporter